ncbi:MAG: ABC transporter permease [Halieaceae bacterium]|jgi:ABC-type lipoprotein release transport system permease subunit|nr:ABC transporter permease [Halieaceae bacterium]
MADKHSPSAGILATLAWRNLWRNYRRTLIMLTAIVVGVWAMILFSAMMRGMLDEMVQAGLRVLPGEVQVHHPDYQDDPSVVNSMSAPKGKLLQVLNTPPVTAWTTRLKVPGMISSERDNRGVLLLGVDPAGEIALGFDPGDIVQGRFLESADDKGIVIGRKLAERLETRLGKRVVIMSQNPYNDVADRGVRIVGIYRARLQATEELFVYTSRALLQKMLEVEDEISEVAITADNYEHVDAWWRDIDAAAGPDLDTQPWTVLDAYLGSMYEIQGTMNVIIMVIIFIALSFGLVNTLVMAVFERVREIGLMMALGMRPQWIMYQVLLESLMLLSLGLVIGNALATATVLPLESGIDISVVGDGLEMYGMGATLYPTLALEDMLMSTLIVLVLGLLASLIPAWRASRYNPVEALTKT